jgi:Uma2 family endonuclease
MKIEEPDLSGTYSYADYLTWRFEGMVELIHGKIYKMSPAPSSYHQRVVGELHLQIATHLKKKHCQVFIAPFDVRFPKSRKKGNEFIDTVVQPDLCVICDLEKIDAAGCLGAPDWIIEILSPHTSAKDLRQKFDVYEKSKVGEYWVADPVAGTMLVYKLNNKGKYEGHLKPYVRTDQLTSKTLPSLTIDLSEVFETNF